MNEKKVELSEALVKEILKMGNVNSTSDISDANVLDAIYKIKNALNAPIDDISFNPTSNNILVVDDIGVVTYQLKILLRKLGYNVQVAKDIFSGLNTFVRSNYAIVIMDLFVSTEQEGYTLLNETKKIITKNKLDTKIVVITASNKAENKVKCLNGGADYFLKKDAGWQDKLVELIENLNQKKESEQKE